MIFYIFAFLIIAVMRVIQKVCGKKVSIMLQDKTTFFHYSGYYNLVSALIALVIVLINSFSGFNVELLVCSLFTGIFLVVDLLSSIEALKGATISLVNICSMGGLFLACILGIFIFNEPISIKGWIGLVLFLISTYFLSAGSNQGYIKLKAKTIVFLFVNFLANGLVIIFQSWVSKKIVNPNLPLYNLFTFGLSAIIMYIIMSFIVFYNKNNRNKEMIKEKLKMDKKLYIWGGLLAVAVLVIGILIPKLQTTLSNIIVLPISSAICIILSFLVGTIIYKEKVNIKNIIGVILGIVSIAIINL